MLSMSICLSSLVPLLLHNLISTELSGRAIDIMQKRIIVKAILEARDIHITQEKYGCGLQATDFSTTKLETVFSAFSRKNSLIVYLFVISLFSIYNVFRDSCYFLVS